MARRASLTQDGLVALGGAKLAKLIIDEAQNNVPFKRIVTAGLQAPMRVHKNPRATSSGLRLRAKAASAEAMGSLSETDLMHIGLTFAHRGSDRP